MGHFTGTRSSALGSYRAWMAGLCLVLAAPAAWAQSVDEGGEAAGFSGVDPQERELLSDRLGYLPLKLDSLNDPAILSALRAAPSAPARPERYRGDDQAMAAARRLSARVPWFLNYRATSPLATWRVDPANQWRVRTTEACHARLRELGIGFVPYDFSGDVEEGETFAAPAPVILRSKVGGVRFTAADGRPLMSCELAARLPTIARIVSAHGVTRVAMSSLYRTEPLQSFHTVGMGVDIHRMQVEEPLAGPDGETSRWLTVRTDFLETPDLPTCDPSLLEEGSRLGDNERGRRLLAIACELHASGDFATVLTPNYNEGHRGHFHIDIRPDDPRTFLR